VKLYGDGMLQDGELTPEISDLAKKQVQEGIAEEEAQAGTPQKTKVSSAVGEAMNPPPPGLIGGQMKAG